MVPLSSLAIPIVLSAVFVFLASFVLHMAIEQWHKGDLDRLPDEDRVMDALRPFNLRPGNYAMPLPHGLAEMKSPGFVEKMKKGPVAFITVAEPGPPTMGKQLVLWFLYSIVVSIFAAYIASRALGYGADYLDVFRFAGTTAFAGYSLALMHESIWWRRKWSATIKSMIDGLIYALLTAGTLGWLWPRM
ncbi:MAG: hypothetical protein WD690_04240 [Vicinamibacterales bacterium]